MLKNKKLLIVKMLSTAALLFFAGVFVEGHAKSARDKAEGAIKTCEKSYEKVKKKYKILQRKSLKKKNMIAVTKKQKQHNKEVNDLKKNKIVTTNLLNEFSAFTASKAKIRMLYTTKPHKLPDAVAAYTSNCKRFSKGLENYIKWALTGEAPKGWVGVLEAMKIDNS